MLIHRHVVLQARFTSAQSKESGELCIIIIMQSNHIAVFRHMTDYIPLKYQ